MAAEAMLPDAARVLIIVVARIGDTLLATPAIRAMRESYPRAHITVLAHPKRLDVLRHLPGVDRLAAITKHRAPWRGWLAPRRYDAALVYGNDRELLDYAIRVAKRVAVFDRAGLPRSANLVRVPRGEQALHAVDERLLLARAMGAGRGGRRLGYVVAPSERAAAKAWLAARVPPEARPLIALQTVSFPTKAHRDWPLASFAELIERLLSSHPQAHFLLLGDAAARTHAAPLMERFGQRLVLAAGQTDLRQSAALIACADLYIGVDTGPTHLAGAIGVPMVALYHNAYPGRYLAPAEHPRCIVIEHPMTGRSVAVEEAMSAISVDQVCAAARSLLDGRDGAGA